MATKRGAPKALKDEQIKRLKEDRVRGMTISALSQKYHVSEATVRNYLYGGSEKCAQNKREKIKDIIRNIAAPNIEESEIEQAADAIYRIQVSNLRKEINLC